MKFYYWDHKEDSEDIRLDGLDYLINKLGLTKLEPENKKNVSEPFVAFVHPANLSDEDDRIVSWQECANLSQQMWVIFISSQDSIYKDVINLPGSMKIDNSLRSVVNRLEKNPTIVKKFKDSCIGQTGPDISLLTALSFPEKVLARYLIEVANIELENIKLEISLDSLGIDDSSIKNEAIKCAVSDVQNLCEINRDSLKCFLDRMVKN